MIKVTSIEVRSYELDYLDIFWTLNEQSQERIEEYDFFVLRSVDGAGGPYHQIAGPFYNTFRLRDGNVQRLHKWRNFFYKVKWVHRASGREQQAGPARLEAPADRLAMEIRRREILLFREFAGRLVFHFPRLTFGQRCRNCWDTGSRGNFIARQVQQNCATCFDSSFVGGYATPMSLWMQFDPAPVEPQRTDLKEHQFIQDTARTTFFPPIRPKDMIVEAEDRRWEVQRVSFTEKHRATIRQELVLSEIPKDDVRHSVPIKADLLMKHVGNKAMRRPMDLQFLEDRPVRDMVP
jgi:hypothetical protein